MKQETAFGILKAGKNVFLTGSAGTGKTYLLNTYIQYLKERGINPAITAPTGIAASHIKGMTIHSFFGIGIQENVDKYFLDRLLQKEFLYNRLSKLKILIVDEISMVSPVLFSSMDRILRAFKSSDQPFGGVQLILSGDFFQLPPISKNAKEIKFAWQSMVWQNSDLKVCYLEEKFRQNDKDLINILDEIRSGSVSEYSMEIFRSCYKKELKSGFKAAKLYTHNEDVDRINEKELEALPDEMRIFKSCNKGSKKNIERILNSSLVSEELRLKKGALVIFIKNNYEAGYINGTLGKVMSFSKTTGAPIVEIFSGRKIKAEFEDWKFENNRGEIKAVVSQIPLRLAWALTVHKSQGMTLDAAEIDLSKTFEVGQGYVALSRIKSIKGLRLTGLNKIALLVDELVLDVDREMKNFSRLNELKFQSFFEKEKKVMFEKFIVKNNGAIKQNEIKKNKKILKRQKSETNVFKKENTLEITKRLLIKKKTILEISKERKLTESTIMSHIQKIFGAWPDFDFSHLKPDEKSLKQIFEAIKKIKEKNNRDDFLENEQIRLRVIFEYLKEEISYDKIRLALIFLNTK